MSRWLTILNLIGVLALAALCGFQWRANRRVNLEAARLEKTRLDHVAKLAEQAAALHGRSADLEVFRGRLARASSLLQETEHNLAGAKRRLLQLEAESHRLKSSVTNWAAAISERDGRLSETGEQLRQLIQERNEAVAKFNELATRYNTAVRELNAPPARPVDPRTNPPAAP